MTPADGPIRPGAEILLLVATTAVLALLLIESAGIGTLAMPSLALLVALPGLAVSLCVFAHRVGFHCLHMSVFSVVLGSIGVLAGARLDFGQLGLMTIADWCRVLEPFTLDTIRNQVASAPWIYAGMLGGCTLGLALSTRFFDRAAATRPAFSLRFVACNAGMMLGMLVTEALAPGSGSALDAVPAAARTFLMMILGMTAGMWSGWWSAEWVLRGWRRWVLPAALQDASSQRS